MAIIKKFGETLTQPLSSFETYIKDVNANSTYFRITEFKDTFTGGKNGFLIEGSPYLKESTEIKIQILDVNGDPIYYEPGNGIPEYYEGTSKLVAVYVYEDTPIGIAKITILGELKTYVDEGGLIKDVPEEWKNVYNVKWEKEFQVNKLLSNEDKVRFYRRPDVNINEIVKPIFSNIVTPIVQKGMVDGFAQIPNVGTKLADYSLPPSYLLQINNNDSAWTGSVAGTLIELTDLGVNLLADDVVNKTDLTVLTPYAVNGIVSNFTNQRYTASFNYIEGVDNLKTALTGSFAKITISDLTTFVGDVARVKIFRKSQSDLSDYQFIQEIQLESNELLRDLESTTKNEEYYGLFDVFNYKNYWITSSNSLVTSFNNTFLYNSVKLNSTISGLKFFTSKSIDLTKGSEYTFNFNLRKENLGTTADSLKTYISGSRQSTLNGNPVKVDVKQDIVTILADSSVLQKSQISANFKAEEIDNAKLYFEVVGNDWYVSDISLRASQETSFSPDAITFIQPIPRTLPRETFDFRFQFYDINNNYIPVLVEETKTFDGGNLNEIAKNLELIPSSLYFQIDSGSQPLPPTTIFIDVVKSFLTGSVTFTSRSFDFFNNELSSSQYIGGQFPGLLEDITLDTVRLTVENFTGSKDDIKVQFIEYTGECEGVSDTIVITRVQDGFGGVNFEIRPYDGFIIRNSDPSSSLEVQAIRIDGVNEIPLRSNLPFGRSDVKMFVQSGSTYITLQEAKDRNYVKGLQIGVTGSKELNYNAIFNRDSIDGQRTIYLIPSSSNNLSASILTSVTLTDLQDGLDAGVVLFDANNFTINPRTQTQFTPTFSSATASFYRRGTFENPISCSFEVYPSMSINKDFVPEYWMYYVTHSCDTDISVVAYDEFGNIIPSAPLGGWIGYPQSQSKQLLTSFTYTEPWTSASVNVDQLFTIIPEGKPGDESIVFEITPVNVTLAANSRGLVNDYKPSVTEIKLKQGSRYLAFTSSISQSGTFHIAQASITASNITGGLVYFDNNYTESLIISSSNGFVNLSGSITYPLIIHPYYTSSIYTQSIVQQYTKVLDGPPPIQITINPLSANITADEVGFVSASNYAAAFTSITVREGDDFLTFTTQSTAAGTWRIKSIETRNAVGDWNIRTGSLASSSLSTATLDFNRFDFPFISASSLYQIEVYPYALGPGHEYTSSIYFRNQSFTKNVSPVKARSVNLSATSTTVNFNGDGVQVSPEGSIYLNATPIGVTGSAFYQFFKDGVAYSGVSQDPQFEIPSGDATGPGQIAVWKVELRDGNSSGVVRAASEVTISGIKAGQDAFQSFISNQNASIQASLWETTYSGSGAAVNASKQGIPLIHTSSYTGLPVSYEIDGVTPIGVLGYYSASIFTKSNFVSINSQSRLLGSPASINDLTFWYKPAVNSSAEVIYKVDFENGRATHYHTQSLGVQYTPPAPYDVKMQNDSTGVVYRVSGEIELAPTTNIIRAYRGDVELTNSSTLPNTDVDAYGELGTKDKCRVSIYSKSSYITLGGGLTAGSFVSGTPASMPQISSWTDPETYPSAEIVFQIDCEGRQTLYKTQSLSVQFEGNTGPGIVMRGIWLNSLDYIGSVETSNSRRDAVIWPDPAIVNKETHYWAAVSGSGPATLDGNGNTVGAQQPDGTSPYNDTAYWQYLGQEEFFVAAQIAIFQESYVKNTINVGTKDAGTSAFANIVIAGGRQDPYIAIGQTGTQGTSGTAGSSAAPTGVIGYDRPGIFLGIYEDGGNGTTGRFSIKTTGTSGKGMFWDGDTLTVVGAIRQREPGVPEGSFRGAWVSGITYYPDDTVTYGDASWINSVTHTSTNNTNIDTGYPPNATNSWTVFAAAGTSGTAGSGGTAGTAGTGGSSGTAGTGGSSGINGAPGSPGAGVVFRGNFSTSNVYYHTTERRDIVRAGSSFYLVNNLSLNNTSGSSWGTPPNGNWSSFGAQFSSVATDVLLAQDATITRGLVMGTEGGNTGFIRSAGASSLLGGTGFYLDVNGKMRFGQEVSGSNNYVYWDGNDLNINGTINAQAGNIGGFTIANNQLIASASLLRIDTQIPQIEFYTTATGSAKVVLNPKSTLTNPGGDTLYVTQSQYDGTDGNRTAISGTTSNNAYITETYSGSFGSTALYASPTYTPTAFIEGGVTNFEVYIPETSLTISGTNPTGYSDYPTDSPSYEYESYYSEYAQGGSAAIQWYLQMFNSTGTTLISEVAINGASTYRYLSSTNYYYQASGTFPGPYFWNSVSYTSPGSYYGNVVQGTKAGQINIPGPGTYQFRLVLRVTANSSLVNDYVAGTTTYYATTATSNHIRTGYVYDASTLAGAFQFSPNLNKTEITNGGIQILSNKDAYVQMYRIEPSSYGSFETLARFIGAGVVMQAYGGYPNYFNNTSLTVNGILVVNAKSSNVIGITDYDTGTSGYISLTLGGRYSATTLSEQTRANIIGNFYPYLDDRYDLGGTSYRWRDIFTNGPVTTTSDANKKFDIQPSSLGLDFINKLQPKSYRMISGSVVYEKDWPNFVDEEIPIGEKDDLGNIVTENEKKYKKVPNPTPPPIVEIIPGKRTHYGLVAQDVKSTLDEMGIDTKDFAGYIAGDIENNTNLGLRYDEFISPMIKAIQELSQRVQNLELFISGSM